ncbi:hypothetical protein ABE218_00330 [Bacillus smithii]
MALKRKKDSYNPNRRPVSVGHITFSVTKDNQRVLAILDTKTKGGSKGGK